MENPKWWVLGVVFFDHLGIDNLRVNSAPFVYKLFPEKPTSDEIVCSLN